MADSELIFVDIDTQVDFMEPAGRLYVPGAEAIVPALKRLFGFAAGEHVPVLSSVDEHAPDDPEFKQWPPHCVSGTPGQEKIAVTLMSRRVVAGPDVSSLDETLRLRKGASPSHATGLHVELRILEAFDQVIFPKATLDAFDNPHFARIIDLLGDRQFVVFGVATDFCVNLATRGLLQRGRAVKIVRDAVRGITPDTEACVCRELSAMGAEWVTTEDLIETTDAHT